MEINLYEGKEFPFTTDWYRTREHAPHADQPVHMPRMHMVARLAIDALSQYKLRSLMDLGAGDGGMLQLIASQVYPPGIYKFWGYDLMQVNVDYARAMRLQDVRYTDVVDEPIEWGDVAVITEVLEHLRDPHRMVRRIGKNCKVIVASSPSNETVESHDGCHAWLWDRYGYAKLIEHGGFEVKHHQVLEGTMEFQVVVGVEP